MATNWSVTENSRTGISHSIQAGSLTTIALNSDYVYNSRGNCFGFMFLAETTDTLTDFWIYVSSYNGTWGNTDGVIDVEIRDGLTSSYKPSSTIITGGSFTITLDGTTTGWIRKSGLSISLTKNAFYYICIGDADGGATNYVTLTRNNAQSIYGTISINHTSSTNGFSTSSAGGNFPIYGCKVGSKVYCNAAPVTHATVTSNRLERGSKFRVTERCQLVGVSASYSDGLSWGSTFKLYADGVNPGGATLATTVMPAPTVGSATSPMPYGCYFGTSGIVLQPNTWYRLVCYPDTNVTLPRKVSISGSPDATLLTALIPFNGDIVYTIESGGVWSDDTSAISYISPVLVPATSPTIVS